MTVSVTPDTKVTENYVSVSSCCLLHFRSWYFSITIHLIFFVIVQFAFMYDTMWLACNYSFAHVEQNKHYDEFVYFWLLLMEVHRSAPTADCFYPPPTTLCLRDLCRRAVSVRPSVTRRYCV